MATGDIIARIDHKARPEDGTLTAGHVRYFNVKFDVDAQTSYTWSSTWPYPVDMLAGVLSSVADKADHTVEVSKANDGFSSWSEVAVGTVATAAGVSATILTFSSTVVANVDPGDFISINGNTYHVIAKDIENDQLTIETGLTEAIAVNDPAVLCRYFIGTPAEAITFGPELGGRTWGRDTFDSTRIPVGVTLKIKYDNNHATQNKTIFGELGYLY